MASLGNCTIKVRTKVELPKGFSIRKILAVPFAYIIRLILGDFKLSLSQEK
jgi:hypothetical protein